MANRIGMWTAKKFDAPTTHLIATVDDSTDMLDFDSEDIDGMDDNAGDEQQPLPTGHWMPTSSHDIHGGHTQRKR